MPGIDGVEALKRLKQLDETRSIPVVAVSVRSMNHEIKAGNAAGFDDYITKPISADRLHHVLGGFLAVDTSD